MRAHALAGLLSAACATAPAPSQPLPVAPAAAEGALEILAVASASTASQPAPAFWKAGDVLKHMPARCDYGRAYFNLDELLADGGAALVGRLVETKLPESDDGKSLRTIVDAFQKAGKNPYTALKEIAFCFDKAEGASVAALRIDLDSIEKPAELMAKSIERREGKPPKVDTAGGFVWVERADGKTLAVGENLILLGHVRKTVESGAGGSVAAKDFGDAARHLIWVRVREKESTVEVDAIGGDLDLQIETQVGPGASSMVQSWQTILPQIETMMGDPKLAPARPLLPAARRASIQAVGERVLISTRMPKGVVREVLQGFVDSPGSQLESGL